VAPASPVTVKDAAVIVPGVAARNDTPPVADRVPAGVRTTVPTEAFTATFPKFMSTSLEIAMGVTIVAVAVAEAVTCANALDANKSITIELKNNLLNNFILNLDFN